MRPFSLQRGQGLVEYAPIIASVALIVVAALIVVVALVALGPRVASIVNRVNSSL